MEIYSRHITNRLWFLRVLLPVLLLVSIDAFSREFELIGYISALLVVFLGFIRVTGITVYHDSVTIKRYYFFGIVPFSWSSDKNSSDTVELVNRFEEMRVAPTDTLADLIIPFLPVEGQSRGIAISYRTAKGKRRKEFAAVTSKEYKILISRFKENNTIPSF